MVRKKIFEPCRMEYKEYDKPVDYTEEFLKEIASNTTEAPLVLEKHMGKSVGTITNLTFTDGGLWADITTDESLDNLGYSPSFDSWLVEESEFQLATNGKLLEVCATSNPRQAILNNTAENNGGSTMSNEDKTKEFLADQVEKLQKENAKLQFKIDNDKSKVKELESLQKEVEELRETNSKNSELLDEQKPIIEKYNAYQKSEKEKLLDKVSNGNEELKEKFKDFSVEHLQTIADAQISDQPAKGAGTENAPGLGEGNGETDEEAEEAARSKAVENMFSDIFGKEE